MEEVKGKAKEAAGKADREDLYREGQAQRDKADSEREAAKKPGGGARAAEGERSPRTF